jgi:hypothetical protein
MPRQPGVVAGAAAADASAAPGTESAPTEESSAAGSAVACPEKEPQKKCRRGRRRPRGALWCSMCSTKCDLSFNVDPCDCAGCAGIPRPRGSNRLAKRRELSKCVGCDYRLCVRCMSCMSAASNLHEYPGPRGWGIGDSVLRQKIVAFGSSQHARLGASSNVPELHDEVLRRIFEHMLASSWDMCHTCRALRCHQCTAKMVFDSSGRGLGVGESGVAESDIKRVMEMAQAGRTKAITALKDHGKDPERAISALSFRLVVASKTPKDNFFGCHCNSNMGNCWCSSAPQVSLAALKGGAGPAKLKSPTNQCQVCLRWHCNSCATKGAVGPDDIAVCRDCAAEHGPFPRCDCKEGLAWGAWHQKDFCMGFCKVCGKEACNGEIPGRIQNQRASACESCVQALGLCRDCGSNAAPDQPVDESSGPSSEPPSRRCAQCQKYRDSLRAWKVLRKEEEEGSC